MFMANRDPRRQSEKLGMGGQITARRAVFAKGPFYVEVAANPEGDHTTALREWVAALEKALPGDTALPKALAWFPVEQQQSLRLVPESVLGLRVLKRGYVAQYDFGKAFLVLEETPDAAGAVLQKLRTRFGDTSAATVGDEAFQGADHYLGRLCIFRSGRYVGGYANVADSKDPVALAAALAANTQQER
jgi:hypothetical protein